MAIQGHWNITRMRIIVIMEEIVLLVSVWLQTFSFFACSIFISFNIQKKHTIVNQSLELKESLLWNFKLMIYY